MQTVRGASPSPAARAPTSSYADVVKGTKPTAAAAVSPAPAPPSKPHTLLPGPFEGGSVAPWLDSVEAFFAASPEQGWDTHEVVATTRTLLRGGPARAWVDAAEAQHGALGEFTWRQVRAALEFDFC
jgi:hypothetical protein